jgi:hypothetical protein
MQYAASASKVKIQRKSWDNNFAQFLTCISNDLIPQIGEKTLAIKQNNPIDVHYQRTY